MSLFWFFATSSLHLGGFAPLAHSLILELLFTSVFYTYRIAQLGHAFHLYIFALMIHIHRSALLNRVFPVSYCNLYLHFEYARPGALLPCWLLSQSLTQEQIASILP